MVKEEVVLEEEDIKGGEEAVVEGSNTGATNGEEDIVAEAGEEGAEMLGDTCVELGDVEGFAEIVVCKGATKIDGDVFSVEEEKADGNRVDQD
ncbi:MAG: hypothetical protein ACRYGR_00565 [Janthinobacterium lividum]